MTLEDFLTDEASVTVMSLKAPPHGEFDSQIGVQPFCCWPAKGLSEVPLRPDFPIVVAADMRRVSAQSVARFLRSLAGAIEDVGLPVYQTALPAQGWFWLITQGVDGELVCSSQPVEWP